MLIYLSCFLISIIFIYLGETNKNKILSLVLISIGILIPTVLAGCRSQTVGTDVLIYGRRFYELSYVSSSFSDLLYKLSLLGEIRDYGFHVINYILTRLFDNYHAGLFTYSLITFSFFIMGASRFKKIYGNTIAFRMLIIYFLFYNISLNAMRQMISVSAIYYSISYLLENDTKKFFLISVAATLIHSSGLVFIIFYGCFLFLRKKRDQGSSKNQVIKSLFFICGCLIISLFINQIIEYLVGLGILKNNYLNYIRGGLYDGGNSISLYTVIPSSILAFVNISIFNRYGNSNGYRKIPNYLFLTMMTFILFLLSFSTVISSYFLRISYYFILLAYECQLANKRWFPNKLKPVWLLFTLLLVVIPWYHDIGVMNYHETIPYKFLD